MERVREQLKPDFWHQHNFYFNIIYIKLYVSNSVKFQKMVPVNNLQGAESWLKMKHATIIANARK